MIINALLLLSNNRITDFSFLRGALYMQSWTSLQESVSWGTTRCSTLANYHGSKVGTFGRAPQFSATLAMMTRVTAPLRSRTTTAGPRQRIISRPTWNGSGRQARGSHKRTSRNTLREIEWRERTANTNPFGVIQSAIRMQYGVCRPFWISLIAPWLLAMHVLYSSFNT